jgi:type II secretion system protein N
MATTTHHRTGEALPRPLIVIGIPCAGVLLIALFLIRGFPYDKLGEVIAKRIEQSHGIHLAIGDVGPALQLAGLAIEGTQLRVAFPNRSPQQIDRALVRPAWSMSWFTGEPAFHVELESQSGSADGTLRWNGGASWVGILRGARPELPPIADWIPIGGFEGTLEAALDVSMDEDGLEGFVEFEIRDGSISLPGLPTAPLPFESLTAALASGSGSGKIGLAEPLERAPIGFEFQLNVKPELARSLRSGGLKVNKGDDALAKISGTVAEPKIR